MTSGQITSVPEPWIMLSLTQVIRNTTNQSEFNPRYAFLNFKEYLSRFEDAEELVRREIRSLILKIYNFNTLGNKKYFLDKTPRYYHIIDEIKWLFPSAKIIVLTRNPISVFSSILGYNLKGNLAKLFCDDRLDDLFKAPRVFSDILRKGPEKNIVVVKYEDIVNHPSVSLNAISNFLGLDYAFSDDPQYAVSETFRTTNAVDRKGLIENRNITDKYLDSWKETINTRQKKALLIAYIKRLGPQLINSLGYDFDQMLEEIQKHKVKFNFELHYDYLSNNGSKIGLYDFLSSRMAAKLNNLLDLW